MNIGYDAADMDDTSTMLLGREMIGMVGAKGSDGG